MVFESTDGGFIGPDVCPVEIDTLDSFLSVANKFLASGIPNYKGVRIPLKSDLNLHAWDRYLADAKDKRLMEYLRFGFPICLPTEHRNNLRNHKTTNHFSASNFPKEVQTFINKEIEAKAIIDPLVEPPHPDFHCSPLLSRPKEDGSIRVVLDLSYPKGASVNDFVDRDKYDDVHYAFKFPTIDQICLKLATMSHPLMAKIDIARAFRNLPMDSGDSLKGLVSLGMGAIILRHGAFLATFTDPDCINY